MSDHAAVLDGVERMRAVLARYLPADVAEERARNIGAALADGVEDPERAVIDMLAQSFESHPFADRVLAIVQTRDAWWARAVRL